MACRSPYSPMRASVYEAWNRPRNAYFYPAGGSVSYDMGLAPGGLMRQEVYEDDIRNPRLG